MTQWLADNWFGKSLEDLRAEALAEPSGLVYDALRAGPGNGRRVILMLCVAKPDWLAALSCVFDFSESDAPQEPWETLTVCEVVRRTVTGAGLAYEACRDSAGELTAVAVIATEPRSIEILERVLGLT